MYLQGTSRTKSNLYIKGLGDKGLFLGDIAKNPINVKPYNHQDAIKAIDGAWDSITLGDSYSKIGQLEQAAGEYKKAYMIDVGSRAVSGLLLAMTYEKLSRYDDGVALLDQMIANGELSPNGVKNATQIKDRLLALKNKPVDVPEEKL